LVLCPPIGHPSRKSVLTFPLVGLFFRCREKAVILRVAVVGGGPAGSCAAETLVQAGIETYLIERKLDNAKPCGGAIPLCMVEEFNLPPEIIDRKVRKMKMISPSNVEVNIGQTLKDDEYIGMCRREVMDSYLRNRAEKLGAKLINGTVHKIEIPSNDTDPYVLHYADHSNGQVAGNAQVLKVDMIIGADGANSRVAKAIDAGDYKYAIAFQERMKNYPKCMWVTMFPPTSTPGYFLSTTT
jgi:geranylgeranyl diphosphate/geranylgeranyl-bacteriochlorophyllide a reductase